MPPLPSVSEAEGANLTLDATALPDVVEMPMISPMQDKFTTSHFAISGNQIFLDICAGLTRP
ncbi:MAG: hypothetical protein OIF58_15955, partial [Cohaesibacter sp.]|nr:hypothetical protein [Cohaesibacter sp.]